MPTIFRLVSIARLPGPNGRGVTNEATLFHEQASLKVVWISQQVDCRLKRGCYVVLRGLDRKTLNNDRQQIKRLDRLDKALPTVNPFETIPHGWVRDRSWVDRAASLWEQLSRPFQHLVTAVLWDGSRLERFLTGPAALHGYPPYPNGNLRHAVETAEQAMMLAKGMSDVCNSVLIAAAFLHDAGKADDFRLTPERAGYEFSERGRLVGYRHTILEWLAVARCKDGVIVPESQYLALVHALTATRGAEHLGIRGPQIIEATILTVADQVTHEAAWMSGGMELSLRPAFVARY
ncbi:MAG: metal-dependent phosphohydrolase [Dechloromonas sp.]|nr:MAG: metal-dependent phosphohydrolase [Dechloromonas sp.]